MKKINKKNGFTLIELIVVVTIIAVLTVIGVISYSGTNSRARDSRRMADLEKIRIALELYRQNVGSTYPTMNTLVTEKYLQSEPLDPKTGIKYTYNRSGYSYTVDAIVEDSGSSNVSGGIYRVTNP